MITGRQFKYFLFSQYLADGIRMSLQIILPVLIFLYFNDLTTGITIASGAFCLSICDIPGPLRDRRNGMLYTIGFIALLSLLTGLVNENPIGMGILIIFASFFFSMIGVYGNRASSVGTAALLMMIVRMKDTVPWNQDLVDTILVVAGGTWYMLLALLFNQLAPFRPAQRALGECLHETANYLTLKSTMYEPDSDQDEVYRKLLAQQVVINEKQEVTRELIFKNREVTREPSLTGRLLLISFIQSVDLFERAAATWYDYQELRRRFGATGLLNEVANIIREMAAELDRIGVSIQSNSGYQKQYDWLSSLDKLKARVDALEDSGSHLVLKKILVNLRQIGEMTDGLQSYFSGNQHQAIQTPSEHDLYRFVARHDIDPVIIRNNITLQSASFRHALRMMLTCLMAYFISIFFRSGPHGYWIILTVILILKPGFSLTRQRNRERIIGTIAGGLIAFLILYYIRNQTILFSLVVLFMIGTYTYQRLNYIVMVICITPYLLITLHLLDMGFTELVKERLLDTAVAFLLAYGDNHLLFPNWESRQLKPVMTAVIRGNMQYLDKLLAIYSGIPPLAMDYRLARKELFVSHSNLSAAFHRMLSEPKSKQASSRKLYEFVALNQLLSSNISSLAPPADLWHRSANRLTWIQLKRIQSVMQDIGERLDIAPIESSMSEQMNTSGVTTQPDKSVVEQLDFIYKVSIDIRKICHQQDFWDAIQPLS